MFDSGVKPDDVEKYFLDASEVVVLNDKVWVPIEATLVGKSFFSAWKQGSLKYNEMKSENYVNEISVKEASAKYIAGSHITPDVPFPEIEGISSLLKEDIKQYGMWDADRRVAIRYDAGRVPDSHAGRGAELQRAVPNQGLNRRVCS